MICICFAYKNVLYWEWGDSLLKLLVKYILALLTVLFLNMIMNFVFFCNVKIPDIIFFTFISIEVTSLSLKQSLYLIIF